MVIIDMPVNGAEAVHVHSWGKALLSHYQEGKSGEVGCYSRSFFWLRGVGDALGEGLRWLS